MRLLLLSIVCLSVCSFGILSVHFLVFESLFPEETPSAAEKALAFDASERWHRFP